jgi:L-asparaginase II
VARNPVLIEVIRGAAVESRHRGAFVIVDGAGAIVAAAGDPEMAIYPRSAAKPLQALPLIETGAAARFNLTNREIALACASHRGEALHTRAVEAWLTRIGLDSSALECGAHLPLNADAAKSVICGDTPLTPVHNNCSGKHAGFLSACAACGEPTRGYIEAGHPAQRRVTAALSEMMDLDLPKAPMARDGCGIPVYLVPLKNLALGMARLVDSAKLPKARAEAAAMILEAMAKEPFYVNGTGGFTTEVMKTAPGTVRVKGGAEAVYAAALPKLGLGIALKIDDGAMRAAECATAHILRGLGCFDGGQEQILSRFLHPRIMTVAGMEAGAIRPTPWLDCSQARGKHIKKAPLV